MKKEGFVLSVSDLFSNHLLSSKSKCIDRGNVCRKTMKGFFENIVVLSRRLLKAEVYLLEFVSFLSNEQLKSLC